MLIWLLPACTSTPSGSDANITVQTDLSEPFDECALPCVTVSGPPGAALTLVADDEMLDSGTIGEDGLLSLCPSQGSLAPEAILSVEQNGVVLTSTVLDIRPFGYALGRERSYGAPDSLLWDTDWALEPQPFFRSEPGSWYRQAITSPHRANDALYFSGKPTNDAPYLLGMVELDGLSVVGVSAAPILEPTDDSWDISGQVSPTIVEDSTQRLLFYQGMGTDAVVPILGRATSEDGETWSHPVSGSYGDPTDNKVSHPTALIDESELIELWHLTEDGPVGLSLSDDGGQTFTPACVSLPMRGKSPEVAWIEDRYLMTWATVAEDEDVIRWAESFDGIRWLQRSAPILWASSTEWTMDGMSNAQLTWIDDEPWLLLVGVNDGAHSFGLAQPAE